MKELKRKLELDRACRKNLPRICVSPSLFAMVIDEVTENARKGWMMQILYADGLVLRGKTMEELRENFSEWREAFESKRMRVNLGKTKLMVSGMEEALAYAGFSKWEARKFENNEDEKKKVSTQN